MSPKAIAAVTFPVVRKGYDPEQVRSFLSQLSRGVEELQNRALQAEAKARLSGHARRRRTNRAERGLDHEDAACWRNAPPTRRWPMRGRRPTASARRRPSAPRASSPRPRRRAAQIITAAEQEALRTGEITRSQGGGRGGGAGVPARPRCPTTSTRCPATSPPSGSGSPRRSPCSTRRSSKPDGLQDAPPPARQRRAGRSAPAGAGTPDRARQHPGAAADRGGVGVRAPARPRAPSRRPTRRRPRREKPDPITQEVPLGRPGRAAGVVLLRRGPDERRPLEALTRRTVPA